MKASIHISTDMVKVLAYTKTGFKPTIRDFFTYPLPEECVLNGVILDGAPIIEGLRLLKSSKPGLFKEASLVIDGSFVYTKKITVPGKLNKITYDEVIRDEFAEISPDRDNLICDYFELSTNADGSKEILACAVEYAHAQAYLGIFDAAGIKLTSVHLGILTVLQYVESSPELRNTPFVLNVVDDVILLSMIFQNGVNVFQSRTRLYGDERSTFVRSTLDGLSGIIQFNRSQNLAELTNCYYLGLSDADMSLVAMDISYPDIRFSPLQIYRDVKGAELLPPGAHFAFLNTLVPDAKSDLISNIKMLEKAKARRKPKNKWIPVLACTALVLAAVIGVLWFMVLSVERDIKQTETFLNDNFTERTRLDALKADTDRVNNLYEAVNQKKTETNAKPQLSRQLLENINKAGGTMVTVNGINFSSDNGVLSLSCTGATEFDAAHFVETLGRDPLVDRVYYTGFREGSSGEYIFTIDIVAVNWDEEVAS